MSQLLNQLFLICTISFIPMVFGMWIFARHGRGRYFTDMHLRQNSLMLSFPLVVSLILASVASLLISFVLLS